MSDHCPNCHYWHCQGAKFCRDCGRNVERMSAPKAERPILRTLVHTSVILVSLIVFLNEIYCLINFAKISEACQSLIFNCSLSIGLEDVVLIRFSGIATTILFAILLIVEGACLAYALYRYIPAIRKEIADPAERADRSGLCAASSGLAASLFIGVVYILITAIIGEMPDTEWMSAYSNDQLSFMLTRAGVREELMFRVFWIGVPMMIVTAIFVKDKRCWHYLFGGFGMTKVAFVFIILSSIMFGLAHDSGWGWSKVLESAMAGIVFGYLYVEYGLYAAILAHTANDTISAIGYMGFQGLEVMVMMLLLLVGLVTVIYWIAKPNWDAVDPRKMETLPEKLEGSVLDHWGRH